MRAVIFTNEGCLRCEDMKAVLQDAGIRYKEYDATIALDPKHPEFFTKYPNWRDLGFVDALALLQIDEALPVVILNGRAFMYKEAEKQIRKIVTKSTVQVAQPEDIVLAVA